MLQTYQGGRIYLDNVFGNVDKDIVQAFGVCGINLL